MDLALSVKSDRWKWSNTEGWEGRGGRGGGGRLPGSLLWLREGWGIHRLMTKYGKTTFEEVERRGWAPRRGSESWFRIHGGKEVDREGQVER